MDRDEIALSLTGWIENLWASTEAHGYLKERGLSDESIERFALGWNTEGYYRGSIVIPYYDAINRLRTIRFRRLEGTPKYDQFKGEKAHLFNVSAVRNHRVYVAEGEFDAMILEQLGYHAVGIQGTQTFKEDWRWLFVGSSVRLILDSDMNQSGQLAALEVARLLDPFVDDLENIELPIGEDVSSLYVKDESRLVAELEAYSE